MGGDLHFSEHFSSQPVSREVIVGGLVIGVPGHEIIVHGGQRTELQQGVAVSQIRIEGKFFLK